MVDVRDVATVAVLALTKDGHEGKAYDLTGPEVVSMAEAADKLSAALGRKIEYVDVSPEAARAGMLHAGMTEELADGLLELFAEFRAGRGAVLASGMLDATGRTGGTFERFAREHVAALAPVS
jgi:uncharacterized protein YbjT (DUF2867 family)